MPRAAILKGYAHKVLPLDAMGSYLVSQYGADRTSSDKLDKSDREKNEKHERTTVSPQRS